MKVIAPCQKCTIPPKAAVMMIGDLDNDLLAVCICPNGHRYLAHQAHSPPEVIYSAGARAFLAEFYSESVVTLTAALERGYELFVKVILLVQGREHLEVEACWKELRNSSERQFGAFCTMYFLAAGKPWIASSKQAEFRNKVAHKGYICTRQEAHEYGEYVTATLNVIMHHIRLHHKDALNQHLEFGRAAIYRKADELRKQGSDIELCFVGSSAIEWNNFGHSQPTFNDLLATTSAYLQQFSAT